jgi:hypothetical protein
MQTLGHGAVLPKVVEAFAQRHSKSPVLSHGLGCGWLAAEEPATIENSPSANHLMPRLACRDDPDTGRPSPSRPLPKANSPRAPKAGHIVMEGAQEERISDSLRPRSPTCCQLQNPTGSPGKSRWEGWLRGTATLTPHDCLPLRSRSDAELGLDGGDAGQGRFPL